jgi:hypothetical protein
MVLKERMTALDNLPIKVDPMPLDLFQQLVPESSLDGSGVFEWSQKEIRLFDEKGKVRNRPKLSMILREQWLIKSRTSGDGGSGGGGGGHGGQPPQRQGGGQMNNRRLTEAVSEATYSCRMSHCHWRHCFTWTPSQQTKLLSQYWVDVMEDAQKADVMSVVRGEILENVGKCFCFLESPVRKVRVSACQCMAVCVSACDSACALSD